MLTHRLALQTPTTVHKTQHDQTRIIIIKINNNNRKKEKKKKNVLLQRSIIEMRRLWRRV